MSPVAIVESVSSGNSGKCLQLRERCQESCHLTSQGQEQKLKGGVEVDLFVDQLGPEDRAVRAEAEQQRGGDLLGGPRDVPPEERQGVQAQLRGPVHTVGGLAADQVPEGDRQSPLNGTK